MSKYISRSFYPWVLWGLGAFLFSAEYFVRTSSSVMVGDLMRDFQMNALGVGVLASCFYYPYLLMQMPVGLLMDRFGPGRLLVLMSLFFSFGCFLFASTHHLWMAELARVIMGISAAFVFVGTLKLVTIWFDATKIGLLAGLTQALGMLGAAIGEGPVAVLVHAHGWREAMMIMGGFIFFLFLLLALMLSVDGDAALKESHATSFIKTLRVVTTDRQTWRNAFFAGLLYAPTLAFGEFWGVSYLEQVHHYSHQVAASSISWIFLGWAVGGPLAGKWSDHMKLRKPLFYVSACMSCFWLIWLLYGTSISPLFMRGLLFMYGLSNTGLVVSYALAGELNAPQHTATTIALTNMASVLVGACCQPLVGWFLTYHSHSTLLGHDIHVYSATDFRCAMIILPILLVTALGVALTVQETHCQRAAHSS